MSDKTFTFIHTADWHLGRLLYRQRREFEHEAFFEWLLKVIQEEKCQALLVSGDIFDSPSPSYRAQELYYRLLYELSHSCCQHVVITAGNHDSPRLLEAPKELLRSLNVHLVGRAKEEEEVLLLSDDAGNPALIVCAVPYLRDQEIRTVEPGESCEEKEAKLLEGIRSHYEKVYALAEQKRGDLTIPIVAMGHLFAAGGQVLDDEGTKELNVGSLACFHTSHFPKNLDYLALGHLHVPQILGGDETKRYSGSPLPMSFGEARKGKSVSIVDINEKNLEVRTKEIPCFQELQRLNGDWDSLVKEIASLKDRGSKAWLELTYTGDRVQEDLHERLEELTQGTGMKILCVKNSRLMTQALTPSYAGESVEALTTDEVFERFLEQQEIPEEQRTQLYSTYREAVTATSEKLEKA